MATKLRRTLFIGLGGTGLQAILHTKKRLLETYGEIPPMMGFLAVDTDSNSINKILKTKLAELPDARLDNSEFCALTVSNPQAVYNQQRQLFSWMPEQNAAAMIQIQFGAGQVRTTGRFASFCNYATLSNIINNKVNQIANVQNATNPKYELANNSFEIHMVFSIGGGTGSGTFIDTAYIVKNTIAQKSGNLSCKNYGYAVMPDVFEQMNPGGPSMARVRPNGYGALMDLDYLMHLSPASKPVIIDYGDGNKVTTTTPPFDTVTLINNSNQAGHIYSKVDDLAELISLGLTVGGSDLGEGVQSVMDNVVTMISGGVLDVENKKAWASGLGLCEIYFDGNKLANIYAEKVINQLILGLNNTCSDNNLKVNNWIDSPDVRIRENNNQDYVLDRILDASPRVPFMNISDNHNPDPEIDSYLNSIQPNLDNVQNFISSFSKEIKGKLSELLKKEINKECGIGNSLEILSELKDEIKIFIKELSEEKENFLKKIENLQSQRKAATSELNSATKTFFNKSSVINNAQITVFTVINELAKSQREIIRRENAIIFFNDLLSEIDENIQKITNLKNILKSIAEKSLHQIHQLQNNVTNEQKTFVIELQDLYSNSIKIADLDFSIQNFSSQLEGNKIYDFMEMNEKLIKDRMWNYAKGLDGTMQLRNKHINDVINDMDQEKLDQVVKQSILKSEPLFAYDHQGLVLNMQLHVSFFVGLPSSNGGSRLEKDNYFKSFVSSNNNVSFTSTGITDKIIIYRQLVSVPAYAVVGVKGYEAVYNEMSRHHNFHIDKNLEMRMTRENFSLYPDRGQDNSIELWVKGLLFQFIKNENGKYYIKSESLGEPIDDYWYSLGSNEYRDEAFTEFKSNIRSFENELKEQITRKMTQMGSEKVSTHLASVNSSNYIIDFSQVGHTKEHLKSNEKLYGGVIQLLGQEINYVTKELN